jgi:hypothetical protein
LADYYGFKTGRLVTDDNRNLTALRIDGSDELDWLLTLGAVVRTEDGGYLHKGDSWHPRELDTNPGHRLEHPGG